MTSLGDPLGSKPAGEALRHGLQQTVLLGRRSGSAWSGESPIRLRSLTEAIDTTTPGGRSIFHIFGALGQFERDLIRERTRAGRVAAAACGRKGGRLPVITENKLRRAKALIGSVGLSIPQQSDRAPWTAPRPFGGTRHSITHVT